ncbi:hypothetical protein HY388_01450 [Candidatus Daviesbacteria bacterium]|nr:hypothetical protein [Candidatus Daviesbacteria bacterium]
MILTNPVTGAPFQKGDVAFLRFLVDTAKILSAIPAEEAQKVISIDDTDWRAQDLRKIIDDLRQANPQAQDDLATYADFADAMDELANQLEEQEEIAGQATQITQPNIASLPEEERLSFQAVMDEINLALARRQPPAPEKAQTPTPTPVQEPTLAFREPPTPPTPIEPEPTIEVPIEEPAAGEPASPTQRGEPEMLANLDEKVGQAINQFQEELSNQISPITTALLPGANPEYQQTVSSKVAQTLAEEMAENISYYADPTSLTLYIENALPLVLSQTPETSANFEQNRQDLTAQIHQVAENVSRSQIENIAAASTSNYLNQAYQNTSNIIHQPQTTQYLANLIEALEIDEPSLVGLPPDDVKQMFVQATLVYLQTYNEGFRQLINVAGQLSLSSDKVQQELTKVHQQSSLKFNRQLQVLTAQKGVSYRPSPKLLDSLFTTLNAQLGLSFPKPATMTMAASAWNAQGNAFGLFTSLASPQTGERFLGWLIKAPVTIPLGIALDLAGYANPNLAFAMLSWDARVANMSLNQKRVAIAVLEKQEQDGKSTNPDYVLPPKDFLALTKTHSELQILEGINTFQAQHPHLAGVAKWFLNSRRPAGDPYRSYSMSTWEVIYLIRKSPGLSYAPKIVIEELLRRRIRDVARRVGNVIAVHVLKTHAVDPHTSKIYFRPKRFLVSQFGKSKVGQLISKLLSKIASWLNPLSKWLEPIKKLGKAFLLGLGLLIMWALSGGFPAIVGLIGGLIGGAIVGVKLASLAAALAGAIPVIGWAAAPFVWVGVFLTSTLIGGLLGTGLGVFLSKAVFEPIGANVLAPGQVMVSTAWSAFTGWLGTAVSSGLSLAGNLALSGLSFAANLGSGLISALSGTISIGSLTIPIVAAIAAPPILGVYLSIITAGAFVGGTTPTAEAAGGSLYIEVKKQSSLTHLQNSDLPKQIQYTITVTAKLKNLQNIKVEDHFLVQPKGKDAFSVTQPPCLWSEIAVGSSQTCTHTITAEPVVFIDSLIINTAEVTADVPEASKIDEFDTARSVVIVGNPPTCGQGALTKSLLPNPIPLHPDVVGDLAINRIEKMLVNLPIYLQASQLTGIPCEVLAGIHWIEGGFNPGGSLVSGRTIGTPEPDVRACAESGRGRPGHPVPIAGGCGFESLLDSAIYAGNHLIGKIGGVPKNFPELVTALSRYNGGGNRNNKTGELFEGESDPYAMNFFDEAHRQMFLLYCGDFTLCAPPRPFTRDGAATAAKEIYLYLSSRL